MSDDSRVEMLTVPVDHIYKAVIRMTKQRDRIKHLEAQLKEALTLIEEVTGAAGYDWRWDDERFSYVEPQVDKSTILQMNSLLEEYNKEKDDE